MTDISMYARMIEASWANVSDEQVINGIRLKGHGRVLVAKARDISMSFEFQYKGEKVEDFATFCAWIDPNREAARLVDQYDLGPDQDGEICCICEITEDWYVIDHQRLLGRRFVKWSAPIVDDLTRRLRSMEPYATKTEMRNVVWSTLWTDEKNAERLQQAHDAFFKGSEQYKDGWEEKLISLAQQSNVKSLAKFGG